MTFVLPPSQVRAVKLWLHRLTSDGASEGLAGRVTVGAESRAIETRSGQLTVPLRRRGESIEIVLTSIGRQDGEQ